VVAGEKDRCLLQRAKILLLALEVADALRTEAQITDVFVLVVSGKPGLRRLVKW